MQYLQINVWPAGYALVTAVVLIIALRALELYAHRAVTKRTLRALQQALHDSKEE